jgi:DNA polymerase-1
VLLIWITANGARAPSPLGNTAKLHRALGNAYVQGAAAVVFCAAGNRLRRLYREHDARLIIPVHDAFVFEAPTDKLRVVADLTKRVMIEAVQERFPELRPRAEANFAQPHCWNYDGHADSVERFLEDPTYSL